MASEAQLLYAKDKRNSYNTLFAEQQKQRENVQKKNRRMGFGRLAGTLLGGALAASTGGLSLLGQAAFVGAGSFVGQKLAGGTTRKLDPLEKGKFFREETDAASDEYSGAISDLKRLSGQRALSDAFSTFALGGLDKIPGLSEAGQKIKGFAGGGAEGGLRDLARGGISKASNIAGDIARGGAEGGVRDIIRTGFNNNPLTQAIDNTGAEFTGSAEQNRALAQNLGLDPNVSIVDQMKAKGLDSSFESRASMFQQGKGLTNTGVDISNKATSLLNPLTGLPVSTTGEFLSTSKQGDILTRLGGDPNLVPYMQDEISTSYLNPDFEQRFIPTDEVDNYYQNTIESYGEGANDVGNYYPSGLAVEDSDLLNLESNQREFYRMVPSYPGTFNPTVPTAANPTIRNRSDYRGGY